MDATDRNFVQSSATHHRAISVPARGEAPRALLRGAAIGRWARLWGSIAGRNLSDWRWPSYDGDPGRIHDRLYVARGPAMTVKVGRSGSPVSRVKQFGERGQQRILERRLGARGEPRLLLQILDGTSQRERALHALLAHERVDGEWFRGPDSELLVAILCGAAQESI